MVLMRSILKSCLLIILAGCLAAAASHLMVDDGIEIFGKPPCDVDSYPRVSLEEAMSLWESGLVVFVDARPQRDFHSGHIPGALSLPSEDQEALTEFFTKILPEQELLIYCAGGACKASDHVAEELESLGYSSLTVFAGGWPAWTEAGLSVETSQ